MPGFCTKCGAPLAGSFCTRCGQRAQTPAESPSSTSSQPIPAASQPTVPQPAPAAVQPTSIPPVQSQPAAPVQQAGAAQKSGAGKAILIVGGIVLVLCLAAFGAVIYSVHWMKGKVSSLTGGAIGGRRQVLVSKGNMCRLLSTQDLQQVLGVTIEKSAEIMEGNDPGCAYYTNPSAFADLQKIALEQAKRDSERAANDPSVKNSKGDNPLVLLGHTEEMEGTIKGLGLTQPDKDGKVFSFTVDGNFGAGNWGALRTPLSIVPGFKEIDGVGDHAMIGSFGHAFYVLKGDNMIHLDTMYVPETRTRGAEIGRKIVSHL